MKVLVSAMHQLFDPEDKVIKLPAAVNKDRKKTMSYEDERKEKMKDLGIIDGEKLFETSSNYYHHKGQK